MENNERQREYTWLEQFNDTMDEIMERYTAEMDRIRAELAASLEDIQ